MAGTIAQEYLGRMQNLGEHERQDFGSLRERCAQGFKIALLGII